VQKEGKRMSAKRWNRRAAVGALLTITAAVALAGAGAADAVGRYSDAPGDGKGAADITGVAVSSDANGQIVFMISSAGQPDAQGGELLLFLDTDANPSSGAPGTLGSEYILGFDEESYGFGRWAGSDWDWETPYSTVGVTSSSSGALISVNRSELGGTGSFNFWVRTRRGDPSAGQLDDAPDDGGFNYTLAAGGPDIREVSVQTTPDAGPRAGRPFVVKPGRLLLPFTGATLTFFPEAESYTCVAKLGAKSLRGKGTGGCTFAIPKKAKGKRLSVVLTVSYQGASKPVQLVYRVR
jgi:hypothetical protein